MSVKLFLKSYVLYFRTEFLELALFFVLWNGIPRCFLFRGMVQNRIPSVCFYFCSTEWNLELFSLLWNGLERNSESFLFRVTAGIPPEQTNCSIYYIFHRIIFLSEIANPSYTVHLLLCPSNFFRHGNKNTLFLVMVYSALFNDSFKALNLF